MTIAPSRFARSALLLVGSAALAIALAVISTPRFARARVPPLDSLPWAAVGRHARPKAPVALLYVQSRCSHCSRAGVTFDSIVSALGVDGIVVTSDLAPAAELYRAKLSLHAPIALDTTKALLHALKIQSVPTLIVFGRDGSRYLTVGFRDAAPYRRLMLSLK
jgi:hypothetical protein